MKRYRVATVAAWSFAGILAAFGPTAEAEQAVLKGSAQVIDGDSLTVAGQAVDLFGITAPRFNQQCRSDRVSWSCGRAAARALDRLVAGHEIACVPRQPSAASAHLVARCTAGSIDVAEAMVERGFAVAWKDAPAYVAAEQLARAQRLGIWRDGDIDPWLWRPEEG
ncbi:MAG: thermonuclease family protein [Alphaproteobacteria bacterium]